MFCLLHSRKNCFELCDHLQDRSYKRVKSLWIFDGGNWLPFKNCPINVHIRLVEFSYYKQKFNSGNILSPWILFLWSVVAGRWSVVGGRWSVVGGRWSVVGGRWSVVGGRWSVVGGRWSVAGGRWSVVGGRWSVVGGRWYVVCGMWSVIGSLVGGRWIRNNPQVLT